jgi:N utilization substance protein B
MDRNQKRKARIFALKMAYAYEMTSQDGSLVDANINIDNSLNDQSKDIAIYSKKIVNTCVENIKDIDSLITSKSANWDINRIAFIDKIIIRLALTEMMYFDDVPPKVSIVEAVEISKEFSTKDSSSFINGILDSIYNENNMEVRNIC